VRINTQTRFTNMCIDLSRRKNKKTIERSKLEKERENETI